MIFFKIALLNIRKHWKRSLLIIAGIAISVIVMEFVAGFMMGMKQNFFTNILEGSGHIHIHAAGYKDMLDPLSLEKTIKDPESIKKIVLEKPGAVHAEKILGFGALAICGDNSLAIMGKGIEDDSQFLVQARDNIVQGSFSLAEFGILASERVLELLGAKLNEYVSLLVENSEGIPTYLDFKITGVFNSGAKEFDDIYVFIRHADAEELLLLQGQTTEIRINLNDRELAASFKEGLSPALAGNQVIIETWQEIFGTFINMLNFFDVVMLVIDFILFIVVATLITNAILMNIFERMREYGTLRAIGMKKMELFSLIITEASVLGIIGSLVGLFFGIPLMLILQQVGIPLGEMVEAFNLGKGNNMYPYYDPLNSVFNSLFGIGVACAAAGYAALVSMKMKIVDSLNYV